MKTRTVSVMTSLLTCAIVAACGPSQAAQDATATQVASNIFATQTAQAPTATSTVAPSPTATATSTQAPTPTPTPGLSAFAMLTLDDMPSGFEVVPAEEMRALEEGLGNGASGIGFVDDKRSQFVMGILLPASTRVSQATFDGALPQLVQLLVTSLGAGANPRNLRGLDDIGEVRTGVTSVSEGVPFSLRWDIVGFRRGEAVVFLVLAYPDGDTPATLIHDLARLLDERISEFIASNP